MIIDNLSMVVEKLSPSVLIKGMDGVTVGDYWSWAYSDIMCNTNRSILAEFVVGTALGVVSSPRIEWDAYDLTYNGKRIEVKCAAYLQSWPQKKLSTIQFDIAKKLSWYAKTGESSKEPNRSADCYVFCLYPEKDRDHIDILNIGVWEFFVVHNDKITNIFGDQKSIGLARLKTICNAIKINELKRTLDKELFP